MKALRWEEFSDYEEWKEGKSAEVQRARKRVLKELTLLEVFKSGGVT